MKAYIYVVKRQGKWEAHMTIEPDVDFSYWFLVDGLGGKAEAGWFWREMLPLGWACRVAEQWVDETDRMTQRKRMEQMEQMERIEKMERMMEEQALFKLSALIEELRIEDDAEYADKVKGAKAGKLGRSLFEGRSQCGDIAELLDKAERWVPGGRETARGYWRRDGEERTANPGEERTANPYGDGGAETKRCRSDGKERTANPYGDAGFEVVAAMAKLAAGLLQGRALLSGEARALLEGAGPDAGASWRAAIQLAALLGRVRLSGAVAAHGGGRADARRRSRCLRCGSGEPRLRRTRCAACGRVCAYCEACLGMGRSRECELLVRGSCEAPQEGRRSAMGREPNYLVGIDARLAKWGLSPAQHSAAAEALRFVDQKPIYSRSGEFRKEAKLSLPISWPSFLWNRLRDSVAERVRGAAFLPREPQSERTDIRNFLLWAVTGAGKTEMIFPLVDAVLGRGGRVLIASPRRDVVLELDPRIRRAFPSASVVTLYGGSEQRWERGDITLSTTHQLFRFHEAFDLVILDEIDAFPYHGDPMLRYAADKSCLPGASRLLLSATPPRELQLDAKRGSLAHARVPVRYHRHPLPVPELIRSLPVKGMLEAGKLPTPLLNAIRQSLKRGAQLFIFVQRIAQAEPMAALIRAKLQLTAVAATSSQDPDRASKVIQFRNADIRILVTTTILERGITIPKSDVYILDADGRLFDEASLVQMAGRAGRSAGDPCGQVYFFSPERNEAQLRAVRHIRTMNRIARDRGYLLPAYLKKGRHAT